MPVPRLIRAAAIPVTPPLTFELWSTADRPAGRRVKAKDAAGMVVFDTNDHHDYGNAMSAAQGWLNGRCEDGTYAPTDPLTGGV